MGWSKCWIAQTNRKFTSPNFCPTHTRIEAILLLWTGIYPAVGCPLPSWIWTNSRKFHRVVKNVKNGPGQTVRLSALFTSLHFWVLTLLILYFVNFVLVHELITISKFKKLFICQRPQKQHRISRQTKQNFARLMDHSCLINNLEPRRVNQLEPCGNYQIIATTNTRRRNKFPNLNIFIAIKVV